MTYRSITSDTICPSVHGGFRGHYPRITAAGKPISMPYGDRGPHGIQKHVFLALCGDTYLVAPEHAGAPTHVHERCALLHNPLHPDEELP